MNFFAFSGLVNGLVSTICGTVVFLQNRHSRKNQIYALYSLTAVVWSFFYFAWHLTDDYKMALFCARGLMVGAIFIPTLHCHLIFTLFDMETPRWRNWLKVLYGLDVFFLISNFTRYFVADVGQRMFFRYWQIPGPLYHPFLALFFFQTFFSVYILWKRWKSASPLMRNEVLWIVVATAIGYASGSTNFFLQYNIPIPPYLNIAVSIYFFIEGLLFFRLGLLDVRVVLKHISIVLMIYGSLLAIVLPAVVPMARYILRHPTSNSVSILVLFSLGIGIVMSIGPIIYARLVRNKVWLRGHLTVGLVHELKSPLGIVQSALDTIQENVETQTSQAQTLDYVNMIRRNVDRVERNVDDLLYVAKLREGEVQLQKKTMSLAPLVQEVVDHHRPSAEAKNLVLRTKLNGVEDIYGDSEKLSLTLSNLTSNAIKFTSKGTIFIEFVKNNTHMTCSVSDEGRGISQHELGRVFESLYQGKSTRKGSGLGLAIAKGFVDAHGGKIWAESKGEGYGTTIRFSLPLHK